MVQTQTLIFTAEMIRLIAEIDEFKGAWRALGNLAPDKLLQLRKVATIESIGSSTRIEGSQLTDRQIEKLLLGLQVQKFSTRDEQEVAGYAELMNILFASFQDIPLSENFIQQLHGTLLKYSEKDQWHKGRYKQHPNHVVAMSFADTLKNWFKINSFVKMVKVKVLGIHCFESNFHKAFWICFCFEFKLKLRPLLHVRNFVLK